ncbi:MAG: 6-phosphofructokinase [Chitinophagales bacterium]
MDFDNSSIRKIGVLTSGGDAPGMNAALRAVVRATIFYGKQAAGIYRGYQGLMEGDFMDMDARSVANIIQRGGTILKSARSVEFTTEEGRKKAAAQLQQHGIDALVVIGGDGTFRGASVFMEETKIPIIGIPGTIDNDLPYTDFTIGYDTACNTVIHAVDAIRDTAVSHNRLFFIEVMGRDSGFIALRAGLAAGVETIVIPEQAFSYENLLRKLARNERTKSSSALVIVAEGNKWGNAAQLAEKITTQFPAYDTRVTVLGHVQRGGTPSCLDREIASRMGVVAVEAILMGKSDMMVGIINNRSVLTPFKEVVKTRQPVNIELMRINEILSV